MSEVEQFKFTHLHECPFCGCAELGLGGNASEGDVHVRCETCGAQGPAMPFVWLATDGWNLRTSFPDEDAYTVTDTGRAMLKDGEP